MALGQQATPTSVNLSVSGTLAFTCLVDARVNTLGPGTLTAAGTAYFAAICPGCGTRYLIAAQLGALAVTITQTS